MLLLITAHKGATNAMTMSWHTTLEFEPPLVGSVVIGNDFSFKALIAECDANLECRGVDPRMKHRYNLFVLEVVKAWTTPSVKAPCTLHHRGHGLFTVAGETLKLASRMRWARAPRFLPRSAGAKLRRQTDRRALPHGRHSDLCVR